MSQILAVCLIAALTIAGILLRPKGWSEAVWACAGAALLILFRLLSAGQALAAVRKGTDVYLFLTGMMLLAELARREGLFDWLASHAVLAAKGSQTKLFTLVYGVGILVTAFLSNDATAVVLTPAVYSAVKKARAATLPYLFICAFIANAASFVLPISNPANLVIFGSSMPRLPDWFRSFAVASLVSIAITYFVLFLIYRRDLRHSIELHSPRQHLSPAARAVALGIIGTVLVSLAASASGKELGPPTFIAAVVVLAITLASDRAAFITIKQISWGVLPMVAGLFVIVAAFERHGAIGQIRALLHALEHWTPLAGALAACSGVTIAANLANNLPIGLLTGSAIQGTHVAHAIRNALVIGVDLGPNLSPTGSLATLLWLVALRREGQDISLWAFLKSGLLVGPPALLLATLCAATN